MPTQEKNNLGETAATNNVNKPTKPKPKKKPSTDNVKDGAINSEYRPLDGAGSPGPAGIKVSPTDWFTSEIQDMMFGFGDCSTPMIESAQLIEEIVRQQMNSLLLQGTEVALLRNNYSKVIGPEDIIFLMRKDKVKMYRLIKYMEVRDLKGAYRSNSIEAEEDVESLNDNKQAVFKNKRFKLCQDFINSIDTTGELSSMFDEEVFDDIKFERNQRLEQRTRCMDQQQYLEFSKARQSTFYKKFRSTKFRDWLMKENSTEIRITASAVELFNYMAYETVAQIIDLALLIKKESRPEGGDPLSRASTGISYNPEFPSVHLTNYTNKLIGPHRPDSPMQTPNSPPLSPSVGTTQGNNSGISKFKAKKRRKSETKNGYDNLSGCIEPHIIREAIQRYFRQSGAFSLFSKSQHSILPTRLMCC